MNRIFSPIVMRALQRARLVILLLPLALLAVSARADIPAAALNDPRYGLGYLVVTQYAGVVPDGVTDCTAGLQNALNDAYNASWNFQQNGTNRGVAVFFPPGTYLVTNTLTCYEWLSTNSSVHVHGAYSVVGSTVGARPKIALKNSSPAFVSATNGRPMLVFACWTGGNKDNTPVSVANPVTGSFSFAGVNYVNDEGELFYCDLRGIDFDCGNNPGAIGVSMNGSQHNSMENVRVFATNALGGFYMLPGAGSVSANIEVDGGKYGILEGSYPSLHLTSDGSSSGPTIAGLILNGQTVNAILDADGVSPLTVAGFKITNCSGIAVRNAAPSGRSIDGCMTFLDGQISMSATGTAVAIYNFDPNHNVGYDFYLRNVYFSGTTNLIKSGNSTNTVGPGTWSHIVEYAYNSTVNVANVPPNSNYGLITDLYESYSVLNGTVQNLSVPFPVSNVVGNSGAPPSDLVSRHLPPAFPSYNMDASDPATLVVSTNAGWNGTTNDDTVTLQSAIDTAAASNGRVFLPGGRYYITNTLILRSNTTLLGPGRQLASIRASSAWKPTTDVVPMMMTEDNANSTTALAYVSLLSRSISSQSESNYDRFNLLTWQAGGNSLIVGVNPENPYINPPWQNQTTRSQVIFTNHGGGKWYLASLFGDYYGGGGSRLVTIFGTAQPIWFYGFNLEHGRGADDCDVIGASNARFLGMKREGGALLVITNSTNIAAYGFGAARGNGGSSGYFQVLGTSTNILFGNLDVQFDTSQPDNTGKILREAITGQPTTNVLWPNYVSIYKRGEINDTNMFVSGGNPPPTPTGLTATRDTTFPSMQIDLSWNGVTNELGYNLKWSAANGGPYSTFTSPSAGSVSANDTSRSPGTTNYYVISAYNSFGESGNSGQASASLRTNARPTLSAIANLTTNINATLQTVNLSGIGPGANETNLQILTVTCWSGNTALIPNPNVSYTSPNTTGTLTFTPATNATGTTTVFVKVQDNGGTIGGGVDAITNTFTVTINNTNSGGGGGNTNGYAILQTAKAPAIDGTIDSVWNTANSAAITNVGSGVITNASECSGTFRLLYDATNLYVLLKVTDDYTDHSTDSTTFIYYNDAIEVYVDANNTKTTNYQANDFHFTMSLVGTNAVLYLREGNNHTNGAVAGWRQTGTNADYVAEMKIPWSLLGQTNVSPNALLGFDAQIDHAHQGGTRDGDLFWHGTNDTDFMDPRQFGTARLESVTADVAIVQTPTAPTIDGTVDAIWSTAYASAITNVGSGVITNASECSGTFQLLYDAANLYVLLQVTDDFTDHSTDSTNFIFYNDAIEVYLDANNSKTTNYVTGDFHFTISLVGTNAVLMWTEANNHTNGVVVAWHQTGINANYVTEMKIPWSLVGHTNIAPDSLMGFDAQIDHAHQGGTRDGDLFWHGTNDTDYRDPTQFGTARLAPAP